MTRKIVINNVMGIEEVLLKERPSYFDKEAMINKPLTAQKNIVLAGFPGVGKSYAGKEYPAHVIDMESSLYHWARDTNVKTVDIYWPSNYIDYIHQTSCRNRWTSTYILTSTHKEVLTGLVERGVDFYIVAPLTKAVAIERYVRRKSPKNFIDSLDANWDTYMKDLESYNVPIFYSDMYLSQLICN